MNPEKITIKNIEARDVLNLARCASAVAAVPAPAPANGAEWLMTKALCESLAKRMVTLSLNPHLKQVTLSKSEYACVMVINGLVPQRFRDWTRPFVEVIDPKVKFNK